jgi:hypothetical protein
MTDATYDMKQPRLGDLEANFDQVLDDVLVNGAPVKILKDTGNVFLFLRKYGAE